MHSYTFIIKFVRNNINLYKYSQFSYTSLELWEGLKDVGFINNSLRNLMDWNSPTFCASDIQTIYRTRLTKYLPCFY